MKYTDESAISISLEGGIFVLICVGEKAITDKAQANVTESYSIG